MIIDKNYENFKDRNDALTRLLNAIPNEALKQKDTILIAVSDGGVIMANEIANRTNLPLDFLFTQSILAPKNPECEIAIVSESMDIFTNDRLIEAFGISHDFVYGEAQRQYEEKILPAIYKFRKGEVISALKDKNVFIIDDGIDSGMIMSVAIKTCINKGARNINIAVPVASFDVVEALKQNVNMLYCVYSPKHFVNTKHYFDDMDDVDSELVSEILNTALDKLYKGVSNGNKTRN